MGDPRRLKKKYSTPMHPWKKDVIEADKELLKEYALKNKEEIWKMNSVLRNFKNQTKKLIALRSAQADKERTQLLQRVRKLGLLPAGAKLDEVLSLTPKNVLERRLQSFVFRKGLARTMKQARQLITHHHFEVNGRIITAPSHLVTKSEEDLISFSPNSSFHNPDHPERAVPEKVPGKKEAVEEEAAAPKREDKKSKSSKKVKKEKKESKGEKAVTKEEKPEVEAEEKPEEEKQAEVKTEKPTEEKQEAREEAK